VITLAACSGNGDTDKTTEKPAEIEKPETTETVASETDLSAEVDYETLKIRFLGVPGVFHSVELAQVLGFLDPLTIDYVGTANGGPETLQALSTGDIDLGFAATNAIINIVSAGNKDLVSVIPITGTDNSTSAALAVLNDSPIQSAKDLVGKAIGMNTLGAQSEAFLRNYLNKEGLSDDEIKQVEFVVIPSAEAEQVLRSKQLDAVVLGGAFLAKANEAGGIRSLTSEAEVWGNLQVANYVISREFAKNNPNTAKKLVEAIAETYNWVNSTPLEEVRAKLEEIVPVREFVGESTAAIPYWLGYGITNEGGVIDKASIEFWLDWAVKQGNITEGQLTPEDIYTNEFNPYAK
jgi:ABC-type nitrate/sulfonate/bicarbonate transport system substrate-binding protein